MRSIKVLGLDLGTKCGWAVTNGLLIRSGVWNLTPRRMESAGMRFVRFRESLQDILDQHDVDLVAFEEVRRHMGTAAAHVYGGLVAILQDECINVGVEYTSVPVGTVKKFATGKGNASKEMMIEAAKRTWPDFDGDDNEADARWIAMAVMGGRR